MELMFGATLRSVSLGLQAISSDPTILERDYPLKVGILSYGLHSELRH